MADKEKTVTIGFPREATPDFKAKTRKPGGRLLPNTENENTRE